MVLMYSEGTRRTNKVTREERNGVEDTINIYFERNKAEGSEEEGKHFPGLKKEEGGLGGYKILNLIVPAPLHE